jgi:RNA polymerase sigma-70 factor (ECF subfamily)
MGVTAIAGTEAVPVASGERVEQFEAFYRAQVDRVHRALAIALGDRLLAREATDEAMARAYARWATVSRLDNPGGWVFRVGLNWATSWWRKVRRERPLEAGDGESVVDTPDPAGTVALAALRRLRPAQRTVVVCRVLLDMSTQETAAALGIAEGTVKSRLARALAELRERLSPSGNEEA